jgi:hypothetical protein
MAGAMRRVRDNVSVTRCVLVSDGQADFTQPCLDTARDFAEFECPIDTVHIGSDTSGEQLLKEIAKITGGLFIKFTDLDSFSKSFKFLAPATRMMLAANNDIARMLGATEVK